MNNLLSTKHAHTLVTLTLSRSRRGGVLARSDHELVTMYSFEFT